MTLLLIIIACWCLSSLVTAALWHVAKLAVQRWGKPHTPLDAVAREAARL